MTTGRRYGGEEAHDAGIVAGVGAEDEILDIAVARAQQRAVNTEPTLGTPFPKRAHKRRRGRGLPRPRRGANPIISSPVALRG
jgi:enoyl-CoA hydratase/carnithine racemase